MQAACMVC